MIFPSREIVEKVRKEYPTGTRVELVHMDDPQAPPIGCQGTVTGVDDIGSILMKWDNGSGLSVAYGEDIVKKVTPSGEGRKGSSGRFGSPMMEAWSKATEESEILLDAFEKELQIGDRHTEWLLNHGLLTADNIYEILAEDHDTEFVSRIYKQVDAEVGLLKKYGFINYAERELKRMKELFDEMSQDERESLQALNLQFFGGRGGGSGSSGGGGGGGAAKFQQFGRDESSYKTLFPLPKNIEEANEIARFNFGMGKYENFGEITKENTVEKTISLDSLSNNQETVSKSKIDSLMKLSAKQIENIRDDSSLGLPLVVHYGSTNLLLDGHHRMSALKAKGVKKTKVRYFDLEKLK